MAADLESLIGKTVTGRSAGWDERIPAEASLDLEPVEDVEPLIGVLTRVTSSSPETGDLTAWLIDGRESDAKTIQPL